MAGTTVKDHFDDVDEFEQLLNQAQSQANSQKEMSFCADLVSKFDEYGLNTYLSDSQLAWLKRIAGESDDGR